MPFGCFGKRKKRDKSDGAGNDNAPGAGGAATSGAAADGVTNGDTGAEINETVVAARTHGQQSANIQKSATLARYDFLRKSDYVNSADRWAALKEQYLAPKMTQSQHGGQLAPPDEPSSAPPAANGPPALGRGSGGRVAQSLPRQFSPPSTVVSVVKFSHWFYERQIREEEARREAQEREEKSRAEEEQQQQQQQSSEADEEAAAAARIQAGFRGYQTRKHLADAKEHEQQSQQPHEQNDQQDQHPSAADHPQVDDIDESDPQLNQAATKIQAGFKGMQARKEVKELREHKDEDATAGHQAEEDGNHHHDNEEHSPEEMNAAAAKIQAGFKGYKTRKDMGLLHEQEQGEQQPQHHEDGANS